MEHLGKYKEDLKQELLSLSFKCYNFSKTGYYYMNQFRCYKLTRSRSQKIKQLEKNNSNGFQQLLGDCLNKYISQINNIQTVLL